MKTCVNFTRMAEEMAMFLPVFGSRWHRPAASPDLRDEENWP
jgi:hypothetical protein